MHKFQKSILYDNIGNVVNAPSKPKAFAQYGSIYEYPNYGHNTIQTYVNQDTELGASALTRDLLMRWARTTTSQVPWLYSGINTLAMFAVGSEYKPIWNSDLERFWWDNEVVPYLKQYLQNCCVRGQTFDFNTVMYVMLKRIKIDGDVGVLFGKENAKIQLIPAHRIGSETNFQISRNESPTVKGPMPETIESDGVIFNKDGLPVGYSVINSNNMVNSILANQQRQLFSANQMKLVFDPDYFDRGRGFSATAPGIIQTLSLQEIERYIFEGIKVQQMNTVIEHTPSGEGPEDEAQLFADIRNFDNTAVGILGAGVGEPQSSGIKIVDGPTHKYCLSNGGDVKNLATDAMTTATQDIITKKEKDILQAMGIPHEIILSPSKISGRMSDGICKVFNSTVAQSQKILDKIGKLIITQAIVKGMKDGDISPNWEVDIYNNIEFSHPKILTLNDSYDRQDDLDYYNAGLRSMNDITMKSSGKTAEHTMREIANEVKMKYLIADNTAKEINEAVGEDIVTTESIKEQMEESEKPTVPAPVNEESKPEPNEETDNESK